MKEEDYNSDLTDEKWSVLEPMILGPSKMGRPRYSKRRVLDGIFYLVRGGIV